MSRKELSRLKAVIESDRLTMTNENLALVTKDVAAVLEDYFSLSKEPEISVTARNGEYIITIKSVAFAVKAFAMLQCQ